MVPCSLNAKLNKLGAGIFPENLRLSRRVILYTGSSYIWVNMGNSKYLRANVVITMHPILLDQLIPIALTQYGLLHSNIT